MDKDEDFSPVQGRKKISRLSRKKPAQEKNYLRTVKKMAKSAADKGLNSRKQTIDLVKIMLRVEDSPSKFKLLKILANTSHIDYLKLFVNNHGLKILYLWMVRCKEADFYLKIAILKTLAALPVSSKTTLKTTKVWDLVEKWSNLANENGQDDIQVVNVNKADEKSDKDCSLSNKVCVSNRSSEESDDLTEIVELEKKYLQKKASQTKEINPDKTNNSPEQKIKSITLDSDCDDINENQVKPKCYDQSGKISEDFVQDIIMQMSIILKERKLTSSSVQEQINLESSQNDKIQRVEESSSKPTRVSILSEDVLSDCHKPLPSSRTKTTDNLSRSEDKVQSCANISSNSKPKNWTAADVSILAAKLLEQWKDLKEVFKIPKIKATKPVEMEMNKETEEITDSSKTVEISDSSKADKISDSSKTGEGSDSSKTNATKDSSKTSSNLDKNKDKNDKNQGNKEVNQQKSANKPQNVFKSSKIIKKKHRGGRNRRFDGFSRFERYKNLERSYPQPELPMYQFGPQDYLGLYQQRNVMNYEYYPGYFHLQHLPWQMTLNNYR